MSFVFSGMESNNASTQEKWKEGGDHHMSVEGPFKTGFTKYVDTLLMLGKEDKLNWTILYQQFSHEVYS